MKRMPFVIALAILGASVAPSSAIDVPPPGAAACSGCHPASRWVGTPFARLVGRNATEIVSAMQEFRIGQRPATVMGGIARGFTDVEIRAIAAWYAKQTDAP